MTVKERFVTMDEFYTRVLAMGDRIEHGEQLVYPLICVMHKEMTDELARQVATPEDGAAHCEAVAQLIGLLRNVRPSLAMQACLDFLVVALADHFASDVMGWTLPSDAEIAAEIAEGVCDG